MQMLLQTQAEMAEIEPDDPQVTTKLLCTVPNNFYLILSRYLLQNGQIFYFTTEENNFLKPVKAFVTYYILRCITYITFYI